MNNLKSIYGSNYDIDEPIANSEQSPISRSISVNFTPKREAKKVPEGAEIKNERKNVDVKEIENGYLICKTYSCEYEINEQYGYVHNCTETFSKEKPNELSLIY